MPDSNVTLPDLDDQSKEHHANETHTPDDENEGNGGGKHCKRKRARGRGRDGKGRGSNKWWEEQESWLAAADEECEDDDDEWNDNDDDDWQDNNNGESDPNGNGSGDGPAGSGNHTGGNNTGPGDNQWNSTNPGGHGSNITDSGGNHDNSAETGNSQSNTTSPGSNHTDTGVGQGNGTDSGGSPGNHTGTGDNHWNGTDSGGHGSNGTDAGGNGSNHTDNGNGTDIGGDHWNGTDSGNNGWNNTDQGWNNTNQGWNDTDPVWNNTDTGNGHSNQTDPSDNHGNATHPGNSTDNGGGHGSGEHNNGTGGGGGSWNGGDWDNSTDLNEWVDPFNPTDWVPDDVRYINDEIPADFYQALRYVPRRVDYASSGPEWLKLARPNALGTHASLNTRRGAQATFYSLQNPDENHGYPKTACGVDNPPDTYPLVAIPMVNWNELWSGSTWDAPFCGHLVRVRYGNRSATAQVLDGCAPCGYNSIDMSPSLFYYLTGSKAAGDKLGIMTQEQGFSWEWLDDPAKERQELPSDGFHWDGSDPVGSTSGYFDENGNPLHIDAVWSRRDS